MKAAVTVHHFGREEHVLRLDADPKRPPRELTPKEKEILRDAARLGRIGRDAREILRAALVPVHANIQAVTATAFAEALSALPKGRRKLGRRAQPLTEAEALVLAVYEALSGARLEASEAAVLVLQWCGLEPSADEDPAVFSKARRFFKTLQERRRAHRARGTGNVPTGSTR